MCCGQRFWLTTTTQRHFPETRGKVGRRCEEQSPVTKFCVLWQSCFIYIFLLHYRHYSFHLLSPSPKRKQSLLGPTRPTSPVLHNQIFDVIKGFNYWLPSTGGVRLLLPLFIFLTIYHHSDSKVCMHVQLCVCTALVRVKIFFDAAWWRSECGPVCKFVVSWPLETVLAEWLVGNGI